MHLFANRHRVDTRILRIPHRTGRLNTRALIACGAIVLLTTGCVSRSPYPSAWDARTETSEWCAIPAGTFTNTSLLSSTESRKLELKQIFFGEDLNGFEVTHLTFETLESGVVIIKPWVGERSLKEEVRIGRTRRKCRDGAWIVKSDWVALPFTAVEGLLWTGGIVIPMATRATFELELTSAGDLAVHIILRTSGTTFVVFPMRIRDADEWFLYPRWTSQESTHVTK